MKVTRVGVPKLGPGDVVVDNSILTDVTCSTRGAMRHVLGLTTAVEAVELVSGSAVHQGLARWLVSGGDKGAALKQFDQAYREWSRTNVPLLDEKGRSHRLRWEAVRRILDHWIDGHDLGEWGFRVAPEAVEVPVWAWMGMIHDGKTKVQWRVPPRERDGYDSGRPPGVLFVALLDAIGQKKIGKGWWSIDHKTTGGINQWYRERQEDSSQFTGQLWAAGQRGMEGLNGVYVNGLELPNLHTSKKTCARHGVAYEKCALQHVGTKLFPITRSRDEIAAWEKTARILTRKYLRLRETVHSLADISALPMEGRFMGACGRCTFRTFCRGGRKVHTAERSFVERRWNPLEHIQRRGGVRDKEVA